MSKTVDLQFQTGLQQTTATVCCLFSRYFKFLVCG